MHGRITCVLVMLCLSLVTYVPATADPGPERFERLWEPGDLKTSDRPAAVERKQAPVELRTKRATAGAPLTFGVPLPRDEVYDVRQMRVVDDAGQPVDASIVPTATWTAGGSLKWVLVDVSSPQTKEALSTPLALEYGSAVKSHPVANPIRVVEQDDRLIIDAGALQAVFSRRRGSVLERVVLDGQVLLDAEQGEAGLYFVDQQGRTFRSSGDDDDYRLEVEFATPMRVVVKATGWYVNDAGERACKYITRAYVYRNSPVIRLYTTWLVTVDTDQMQWRELGLRLPLDPSTSGTAAVGTDPQDSSKFVQAELNDKPLLASQTAIRTARVRHGERVLAEGKSLGNWIDVVQPGRGGVTLAGTDLSGHFPAGLAAERGELVFHAFTPEAEHLLGFRREDVRARYGEEAWNYFETKRYKDPPFETRRSQGQGLAKTHELILTFRGPQKADGHQAGVAAAQQALAPPLAMASPEWNCASGAFGPYHPYDAENFGPYEQRVSDELDKWIHVTRRLEPHYGFYDHGRGIPHHIEKRTADDGEDEFIYSGYRRNYDLGYGNSLVPWLMYLRSGDRRWLRAGIDTGNHELDVRHIHPTVPDAYRRVGNKYWHYGSWSFDGSSVGFQDMWYKNLALYYYCTGYQRAMDVYGEIMESVHDAVLVDKSMAAYMPEDRTGRTALAGSVAVYYKATWDERFRTLHAALTPSVLATQRPDGTYAIRMPWMEYFFRESLYGFPQPLAAIVEAYDHYCEAHVRVPERADQREFTSFAYWRWHQKTGDPIVAVFGKEQLPRYKSDDFNLIGAFGMRSLLYYPQWMLLVDLPGHETASLPAEVQVNQPGTRPVFLQHTQGRPTGAEFSYLGENLEAFDAGGAALPTDWFRFNPRMVIYELNIPADAPTQRITLRATAEKQMERYKNTLLMPWHPGRDRVLIKYRGENPLVDTPLNPPPQSWSPEEGADPRHPAGRFGRALRLQPKQQVVLDLGDATESKHLRERFDTRQGTVEFWVRFERQGYGTLLHLPIEGADRKTPHYEQTLWLSAGGRWDARMYNADRERLVFLYRQEPYVEPGRWNHLAVIWDWDDRDNGEGKIVHRLFLDGYPGAMVGVGGADDSRTYWPNTTTLPSPARELVLGDADAKAAVSIDELRISDVMRYPFGTLTERTFVPPEAPFDFDDHTLLLHSFDQLGDAQGPNGRVPTRYLPEVGAAPDES